jgi:fatty acid synthase subunit alpha
LYSPQPPFILPVPSTTSYWRHCSHLSLFRQNSFIALETQGWQHLGINLADITTRIRSKLNKKADLRRAIARDNFKVINGVAAERLFQTVNVLPRANFRFEFPTLEATNSLQNLAHLRDLIDLDKVVVVGPWGSSRTRWEMEARGEFTIEGCIEMAWVMGFIKHFDGRLKDGSLYVGWVDSKTNEPVDDKEVKGCYEKDILLHAGVRLIGEEYSPLLYL